MLETKQAVVYLAGPFSATTPRGIHLNVEHAEAAALEVMQLGAAVICPHSLGRMMVGALPEQDWLTSGLTLLARCDALYVTSGWIASAGTRGEIDFAKGRGMPIFFRLRDLERWMEEQYDTA